MLTLLEIGSLGFWLFLAFEFVLMLICTNFEKPGWGLISLVATGLALYFLGGINILPIIYEHPLYTALYVAGYFLVGTIWSVIKWYFYVHNRREKYLEAKAEYLKAPEMAYERSKGEDLKDRHSTWEASMAIRPFRNSEKGIVPLAKDNKSRIILWMAYWPWSCLWTMIDDPIKKLFKMIYARIAGRLQSIADKAFKDVT